MTNVIPLEPFVIVTVEDEKNNDNNSVTDEYTEYSATNENVKLLHKNADNTLSLSDNSKSNQKNDGACYFDEGQIENCYEHSDSTSESQSQNENSKDNVNIGLFQYNGERQSHENIINRNPLLCQWQKRRFQNH